MNKPDLTLLNLETERLILRPLTFDDTPFITELLNDPDYIRNIGDRKVRTTDDAGHYLTTGPMESYTTHGFGLLCTTLKPETKKSVGTPIGTCGLLKRDFLDFPDLGYAFLPEFRSAGYAGEAAAGVLQWGKKTFDISRNRCHCQS